MDYVRILLDALNNYCEIDEESKVKLRDIICIISEKEELKKNIFVKELLYIAAQKMRTFGYNYQNNFLSEPYKNAGNLIQIRNEAVKEYYRSKIKSDNFLDKTQKEVIDRFESLEVKGFL